MLRISFDFNETSKSVSNIKVIDLDNDKSRGIVSSTSPFIDDTNVPDLEILENKLQLSKTALQKLGAKADDRLSVQYVSTGIGKAFPVVGKAEVFTDRLDGNRITAKGTVSFRGEKKTTLLEFGTVFTLEEYKDGIWKLVPFENSDDNDALLEEKADAEALDDIEIDKEIDDIVSSIDDDLPF